MSNVKIVNAHTFKIDPTSKYILAIDRSAITMDDVMKLGKKLKEMGVPDAVAIMTNGDPTKLVKIIEYTEKENNG